MRKRKTLLAIGVLIAMFALAKDRTIVVKGKGINEGIKTVVTSTGNDTLSVTPGESTTLLVISVKNAQGTILYQQVVPAIYEDHITIIAPELPEGYLMEVKDDRGYIYEEFDR